MHKIETPAQSPVSTSFYKWLLIIATILISIGLYLLAHDRTASASKKTYWSSVRVPLGTTVRITPESCVKERVLIRGLPWGDVWKEFKDCPNDKIDLGKTGPDFYFQSVNEKPISVEIRYTVGGQTTVKRIIAPPGE